MVFTVRYFLGTIVFLFVHGFLEASNPNETVKLEKSEPYNKKDDSDIDYNIEKYVSPEFHNESNVYNLPTSPDNRRFINEDFDASHPTTPFYESHDFSSELTTPFSKIFDESYQKTVESIPTFEDSHEEEESESKEQLDINKYQEAAKNNNTDSSLTYTEEKNIIGNTNEKNNSIHKDLNVETSRNLDFRSSFNDTQIIDEGDEDDGNNNIAKDRENEETEEETNSTQRPDEIDIASEKSSESRKGEAEIVPQSSTFKPTTRKSVTLLTKPPSNENSSLNSILSNKIETETVKAALKETATTTEKIKSYNTNKVGDQTTISYRGSVKFSDSTTQTPFVTTEMRIERTEVSVSVVKPNSTEQQVQENQIVPVQITPPVTTSTTAKLVVTTTTSPKPVVTTTTSPKPVVITTTSPKPVVTTTTSPKPVVTTTTTEAASITKTTTTTTEEATTIFEATTFPVTETTTTEQPTETTTFQEDTTTTEHLVRTSKGFSFPDASSTIRIESTTQNNATENTTQINTTTVAADVTTTESIEEATNVSVEKEETTKLPIEREETTKLRLEKDGTTKLSTEKVETTKLSTEKVESTKLFTEPTTVAKIVEETTPKPVETTVDNDIRKLAVNETTQQPEYISVSTNSNESTDNSSTDADELNTSPPESNGGTIAAIAISSIGAVCLILLAGLLFVMKKRQKRFNYGQRCRPVSLADYSVDNVSVQNSIRRKGMLRSSKRSYGNPAFEDPSSISHPLNFAALTKFANTFDEIKAEFEEIPPIYARTNELPEGCDTKNRYANVIPLPETRVFLNPIDGYLNSDYINANYVTGPKNTKGYYIACQAPMQNTVDDFWRMIWEQECKVILMMTHLFENGAEKCFDYLPPSEVSDCHRLFGDFQITLKRREVKDKYIISTAQLKNMVSNSWREVTHFWYLGWPEKGVPSEANSLIAFLIEARSFMKSSSLDKKNTTNGNFGAGATRNVINPVVVHCSPGTGRTGVVIACDIAIREFEQTRLVDVPKIVYRIRRDRAGAVQTKEQYAFIYKVINLYATKLTGGALDSL